MHAYSLQKMHMHPWCNSTETSLPWKLLRTYLESCASIVQSVVCCPAVVWTKSVARRCSLKKSVHIHSSSWRGRRCGVAQALFDHPRWCRPHPVFLCSHSKRGCGGHFIKNFIFAIFSLAFSMKEHKFVRVKLDSFCTSRCLSEWHNLLL